MEPSNPLSGLQSLAAGKTSEYEKQQYKRLLAEQIRRESEALRLYEPQPHQEDFHSSTIRTLVMQKGNQVGGTLAGAVEVARAVTGQDPYNKYPKKDGVVACLGYGEKHIGTVFWPKLFKPGAFEIIKDLKTDKWRTYRPWPTALGGDLERDAEKRPAPPLIPRRFIDGKVVWEKRGSQVFSIVRFTTGWELRAYNSAGDPGQAQGFQCDLYWVDEDVDMPGWIVEILFRLMKKRGLLRWTALPHAKNDEMMNLIDRAKKEAEEGEEPTTKVLQVTTFDNKYLSKQTVDETAKQAMSFGEDVYRQRIMGEISFQSVLMYPTFNRRVHDVMGNPTRWQDDQQTLADNNGKPLESWGAARILAANLGEPPDDWTRYVSIDPGYNVCAIEFLAVPPPELGKQVFIYDECYIKHATHVQFGEAMQMKCRDKVFESFIFDFHGGHLRSVGSGELPIDLYRQELEKRGIRSAQGYTFRAGLDDRRRREEVMRTMLALDRNGQPGLMVVQGKCPSFCSEMEKFRKKTVKQWGKDIPTDEGERRVGTHAIEAIEQAIGLDLQYVKPRSHSVNPSFMDRFMDFLDSQRRKASGVNPLTAKPGISLGPIGVS